MGLNDIEIPPAFLAELYSSALIIDEKINAALIPSFPGKEEKKGTQTRRSLGENRKNILIVVRHPDYPVLPDDDLKFLTDILNACKLSLAEVVITNTGQSPAVFNDLKKEFNPVSVILFGVTLEELDIPLRFPEFQVQSYTDQQFLTSPPLSAIKDDKLLKSKLWVSLRKMFNI